MSAPLMMIKHDFFFSGASACVNGTANTGIKDVGGGLRLIHTARERTGWMTPTQSVVLNEERDTALL